MMRAIRKGLQGAGIPVENSKGEWGPGQEEINVTLCRCAGDGRPPRHPEERHQGDRARAGQGGHLHVEVALRPGRLLLARPPVAVGREGRQAAVPRRQGRVRHVGPDALVRGRAAQVRAATSPGSWRPTSTPTSASRSAPSRRPRRCGAATTAPPASACAARAARRIRIECRIGGADLNPYLAFAGADRGGPRRHRGEAGAGAAVLGRCLCRQDAAGGAQDPARGDRAAARRRRCCARRSATRWSITTCTPPRWEQFEYDRRITDWELMRGFERY